MCFNFEEKWTISSPDWLSPYNHKQAAAEKHRENHKIGMYMSWCNTGFLKGELKCGSTGLLGLPGPALYPKNMEIIVTYSSMFAAQTNADWNNILQTFLFILLK